MSINQLTVGRSTVGAMTVRVNSYLKTTRKKEIKRGEYFKRAIL